MERLGARHPSKNTPNSQALGQHSDFEIVNDGVGARYPIITANLRAPDQSSSTTEDNFRKSEGRNQTHLKEGGTRPPNNFRLWHEYLTGLVG